MNINKELREWIEYCCKQFETDYDNLPESAMLEIREFLMEDKFTEQQINKALYNYECQIYEEQEEVCDTCGGDGEIWHSDYYCDMAYSTPCHECNDNSDFEFEIANDR